LAQQQLKLIVTSYFFQATNLPADKACVSDFNSSPISLQWLNILHANALLQHQGGSLYIPHPKLPLLQSPQSERDEFRLGTETTKSCCFLVFHVVSQC
jgi:hypothetical protein